LAKPRVIIYYETREGSGAKTFVLCHVLRG